MCWERMADGEDEDEGEDDCAGCVISRSWRGVAWWWDGDGRDGMCWSGAEQRGACTVEDKTRGERYRIHTIGYIGVASSSHRRYNDHSERQSKWWVGSTCPLGLATSFHPVRRSLPSITQVLLRTFSLVSLRPSGWTQGSWETENPRAQPASPSPRSSMKSFVTLVFAWTASAFHAA